MPSLKLRLPLLRRDGGPTLRERAATLKATAARVMKLPTAETSFPIAAPHPSPDTIVAAIAEHRAAAAEQDRFEWERAVLNAKEPRYAELEPVLAAAARAEATAFAALLKLNTRPVTIPGLIALAEYLPVLMGRGTTKARLAELVELVCSCVRLALASLPKEAGASDASALSLIEAIEREWAAWAEASARLDTRATNADERVTEINRPRLALIEAAGALPATSRAARHAKALAFSWWEAVEIEGGRKARPDFQLGRQLLFDIHTTFGGATANGTAQSPAQSADRSAEFSEQGPDLTSVPLDALFALADLYSSAARLFDIGGFWPKLKGGDKHPGQHIAIVEADRLERMFAAVVAEIALRDPTDDAEAGQKAEWCARWAMLCDRFADAAAITTRFATSREA